MPQVVVTEFGGNPLRSTRAATDLQWIAVGGAVLFEVDQSTCPSAPSLAANSALALGPWPALATPDRYLVSASAPHDGVSLEFSGTTDSAATVAYPLAAAPIDEAALESFWGEYAPDQAFALLQGEDAAVTVALVGPEGQRLSDARLEAQVTGVAWEGAGFIPDDHYEIRLRFWDTLWLMAPAEGVTEVQIEVTAGQGTYALALPVVSAVEAIELARPVTGLEEGGELACVRAVAGERAVLGLAFEATVDGTALEDGGHGDNCFVVPAHNGEPVSLQVSGGGRTDVILLPAS